MDHMYVPMKVVVVGDGAVGKTSMLLCYTTNTFPTDYMATVFDNYAVNVPYGREGGFNCDAIVINLGLWDTAGQEEYAQYRPLSYDKADGFILAFSLVSRASYENVAGHWIKELREKAPHAPIVLVGTKLDLRDGGEEYQREHPGATFITTRMGEDMRRRIGAAAYVECSVGVTAITSTRTPNVVVSALGRPRDNLKKVFDTAIDVHMRPPEEPPAAPQPKGCLSCCFSGGVEGGGHKGSAGVRGVTGAGGGGGGAGGRTTTGGRDRGNGNFNHV